MKTVLQVLAGALDVIAMLGAIGAVWFLFANMADVESGPAFIQIALFAALMAIVPYCLAGAVHRIWERL